MSINTVIVFIVACFFLIGTFDKAVLGGKLGLGPAIDSGVAQIGGLLFFLVGIMCMVPIFVKILTPVLTPLYNLIGADPAAFAGIFIGPDAGGYSMASAMTSNSQVIALSGLYLASMLGVTVVFSLPWGLGVVQKEDQDVLVKGMLVGMVASPIGTIISGLISGFNFFFMLRCLLPAIIVVLLIVWGLVKAQKVIIKIFMVYSRIMATVAALAVGLAGFEFLSGTHFIPLLDTIGDKLTIIGTIGLSMGGALALVYFLQKILKKPFIALGHVLKINDVAVLGIIASLANAMPVLSDMLKDMDPRGKLLCVAFTGPAWCALGSHLAFTSTVMPEYLVPQVIGKIAGGIIAMIFAVLFFGKSYAPVTENTVAAETAQAY